MEKEPLFKEFPPVSTEAWKKKIIADLKGADYRKKLVWKTPEGFDVEPFYRREDLAGKDNLNVLPGDYPFLRGKTTRGNPWLVRQDIPVDNLAEANRKALDISLKGVDALGFIFTGDFVPETDTIDKLLQNIRADLIELNYSTRYPLKTVGIIDSLAKKYNRDLDKIRGSVDYDPLGYFSRYGRFYHSKEEDFKLLERLLQATELLPRFHVLTVDGSLFHNAGSGIVSQLAFTLAKGADYLTYLTGACFEVDQVAAHLRFQFAVGSGYFMEMAKFRAARYLWANIVNAYGLNDADNAAMCIHCKNSEWNKTVYDPYVNLLRTTTETMSSLIAGVHSMEVLPFDKVYENPSEFAERIARNQQLILKYESYFDKVADPAAGSYYIEELTQNIIDKAWALFLEVDEMGGYFKAFEKGFIQKTIQEEAIRKDRDIARRRHIILGTNQYPDSNEHYEHIEDKVFDVNGTDSGIETLKPYRGAQAFERLRYKTDQYALHNKRPVAWMLTYGNLAMRNARARFAGNFFGCAGFEIVNNPGFETIEKGIEAARKANPDIVVICSPDEEYGDIALPVFRALKDRMVIVLAGYPEKLVERLIQEGMEHFIHTRSNVLEELKKYQHLLKIE